ncbi:cell wall hydrolase [Novosphingobium sp. 9]|uniref:cell wall hydrolase n=1 Tax=Novosphingobium sp. 9 TaxID=2025349 RepID=UPI0021B69112|nr:cell wall hydrolase [Novosphingobium sp. 9]
MTTHWLPPGLARSASPARMLPEADGAPAETPAWEPRPRDFAGRVVRGTGRRRQRIVRRRWSLASAALALVAIPAFAAPGDWQPFRLPAAEDDSRQVTPMPFETAAGSFPGAAFYYLDLAPPTPQIGDGIHSDADLGDGLPGSTGPAARSMIIDDTPLDHMRALQCLTQAVYYEAASEPDAGQRAVAQVVLNRVAHPAFPNTVCGVVYQGATRAGGGCQFTFTCDGSLSRKPMALFWDRARAVAAAALAGYVYAPIGLATHYHTVQVHPYWADSLHYLETIGAHRFYALQGPAGGAATFRFVYHGGEPLPVPGRMETPAQQAADTLASDPVALQKAYAAMAPAPAASASPVAMTTPAPSSTPPSPLYSSEVRARGGEDLYRAQNLPQTTGVKDEYANSGRWIAQPGQ